MKHKISLKLVAAGLIAGAAFIVGCPHKASAWLGDTYAQSVRVLGQPLTTRGNIIWWHPDPNRSWVGETFYHNQCVSVLYVMSPGRFLAESEIWRLLQGNSRPGATWKQYSADSNSIGFVNDTGDLYGLLARDGSFRVCYKSFLDRHGLWHGGDDNGNGNDNDLRPPVEDGVSLNGPNYTGRDWLDGKRYYVNFE